MNILVLGSGGREHALAWKIAQDAKVTQVFVAPGNAGTATEPKCVNVQLDILDNPAIIAFAKENNVELIVVGPEAPLVNGVVDAAREAGVKFGDLLNMQHSLKVQKHLLSTFKTTQHSNCFYEVFTEVDAAKAYVEKMVHQL